MIYDFCDSCLYFDYKDFEYCANARMFLNIGQLIKRDDGYSELLIPIPMWCPLLKEEKE